MSFDQKRIQRGGEPTPGIPQALDQPQASLSNFVETDKEIIGLDGNINDKEESFTFPDSLNENSVAIWARHPPAHSLFTSESALFAKLNAPSMNLGDSMQTDDVEKEIGGSDLKISPTFPNSLQSMKQVLLKQVRDVVSDTAVADSKLQFVPQWLLDKAIRIEKLNIIEKETYHPVSFLHVPKGRT